MHNLCADCLLDPPRERHRAVASNATASTAVTSSTPMGGSHVMFVFVLVQLMIAVHEPLLAITTARYRVAPEHLEGQAGSGSTISDSQENHGQNDQGGWDTSRPPPQSKHLVGPDHPVTKKAPQVQNWFTSLPNDKPNAQTMPTGSPQLLHLSKILSIVTQASLDIQMTLVSIFAVPTTPVQKAEET